MGRSNAYITVFCDECMGGEEQIRLTITAHGYGERDVNSHLKAAGWLIKDDKDYCPNCKEEVEEMEVIERKVMKRKGKGR